MFHSWQSEKKRLDLKTGTCYGGNDCPCHLEVRTSPSESFIVNLWNAALCVWHSEDCALWYIPIIKPIGCTISQLYFGKELYMFRTDFLSIIRGFNTVFIAIGVCQLRRHVGRIFLLIWKASQFSFSYSGFQKDVNVKENVTLLYTAFTGAVVTLTVHRWY